MRFSAFLCFIDCTAYVNSILKNQGNGFAVSSVANAKMTFSDVCFTNNEFLGSGVVIAEGSIDDLTSSNVFGTVDPALNCPYASIGFATCVDYDSFTCSASNSYYVPDLSAPTSAPLVFVTVPTIAPTYKLTTTFPTYKLTTSFPTYELTTTFPTGTPMKLPIQKTSIVPTVPTISPTYELTTIFRPTRTPTTSPIQKISTRRSHLFKKTSGCFPVQTKISLVLLLASAVLALKNLS